MLHCLRMDSMDNSRPSAAGTPSYAFSFSTSSSESLSSSSQLTPTQILNTSVDDEDEAVIIGTCFRAAPSIIKAEPTQPANNNDTTSVEKEQSITITNNQVPTIDINNISNNQHHQQQAQQQCQNTRSHCSSHLSSLSFNKAAPIRSAAPIDPIPPLPSSAAQVPQNEAAASRKRARAAIGSDVSSSGWFSSISGPLGKLFIKQHQQQHRQQHQKQVPNPANNRYGSVAVDLTHEDNETVQDWSIIIQNNGGVYPVAPFSKYAVAAPSTDHHHQQIHYTPALNVLQKSVQFLHHLARVQQGDYARQCMVPYIIVRVDSISQPYYTQRRQKSLDTQYPPQQPQQHHEPSLLLSASSHLCLILSDPYHRISADLDQLSFQTANVPITRIAIGCFLVLVDVPLLTINNHSHLFIQHKHIQQIIETLSETMKGKENLPVYRMSENKNLAPIAPLIPAASAHNHVATLVGNHQVVAAATSPVSRVLPIRYDNADVDELDLGL